MNIDTSKADPSGALRTVGSNKIDTTVFKAYDIRGVYPTQINAELVYKIAQAYVKFIKPKTVVVGHDMRLCGEEFSTSIIKALTNSGVNVINIGLVSTDQLYFAGATLPVDGGIQITASHNPKEYGGLKLVREKSHPISGDSGIYEIRDLVTSEKWKVESEKKGTVTEQNILEDYYKHVLKTFNIESFKKLKIVANTNFGMATPAVEKLKTLLPVEFVEVINGEVNGNFPKGRPDPLRPENRDETIEVIKKLKPDLGVAWDADADRCFFFDEKGGFVTAAYINALLAEFYLKIYPGSKILHDTRVVRVIDAVVKQNGGVSVTNKAGHSFIKEKMIADDIVFGCETSGHYFFKDNFYLDNGLLPLLAVLEILSTTDKPFSEVLKPLREKFFISEEINFEYINKNILEGIKEQYSTAKIENIDGYDFNFPDWRFNVRLSNTENLLRINLEANSAELLKQKIEEVSGLIEKIK